MYLVSLANFLWTTPRLLLVCLLTVPMSAAWSYAALEIYSIPGVLLCSIRCGWILCSLLIMVMKPFFVSNHIVCWFWLQRPQDGSRTLSNRFYIESACGLGGFQVAEIDSELLKSLTDKPASENLQVNPPTFRLSSHWHWKQAFEERF